MIHIEHLRQLLVMAMINNKLISIFVDILVLKGTTYSGHVYNEHQRQI